MHAIAACNASKSPNDHGAARIGRPGAAFHGPDGASSDVLADRPTFLSKDPDDRWIHPAAVSIRTRKRNRARRRLGRLPPTPEFLRFGSHFHQDIDLLHDSIEEAVSSAISVFRGEDRRRLRDFIRQVLESDLSPDELSKPWGLTRSDWRFDPRSLRIILALAHDRLRKGL